jgi:hypothetical protein
MIIRNIFLLLLLAIFTSCSYQNSLYHKHINHAYIQITEGDYKASVKSFKKAFQKTNRPLANDYYNAFQAALKVNDQHFVSKNAIHLAELGMCNSFFLKYPQITNDAHLKDQLLEISKQNNHFNEYYRDTLNRMMQEDQRIHGNRDTWPLRRYTDSINFIEFKSLVNKYGFPSERKIGIECTAALEGFKQPVYDILLIHFAGQNFEGINSLLESWKDSMYISPADFLTYNSWLPRARIISGAEVYGENGGFYVEKSKEGGIEAINRTRKKYEVWPLEVQIKIIQNHYSGINKEFRLNAVVSRNIPPEVLEKYFIKVGEDVTSSK